MKELKCKNAVALDKCLRLLYANKIEFKVEVCESDKGKIYYSVLVDLANNEYERIKCEYEQLIK